MKNYFDIPLISSTEPLRLIALRSLNISVSFAEPVFDALADQVAKTFHVPVALILIVDADKVHFKGNFGMRDLRSIERGIDLCSLAALQPNPILFTDADRQECLKKMSFSKSKFNLNFYTGIPLVTDDGYRIGTVCIIDRKARYFDSRELKRLQEFANISMQQLYADADI